MQLTLANISLTQGLVQHLFNYDLETGVLKWRNPPGIKVKKGAHAGTKAGKYYRIKIYGKNYRVHRIIWLYVYGYFPENEIDHIDRNGQNNKINNLREVSRQCNMRNSKLASNSTSAVKGVSFAKNCFMWKAHITVNKQKYSLGFYSDYIEAVCIRLAAEQCLDWYDCDANSTAYQCIKSWLNRSLNLEEV